MKAHAQDGRDGRPRTARDGAAKQDRRQCQRTRKRVRSEGDRGRSGRSNEKLSFSADVEDAGAKRDGDGEPGENQRCGADQRPDPSAYQDPAAPVTSARAARAMLNPVAARSPPVPTTSTTMSPAAIHRERA